MIFKAFGRIGLNELKVQIAMRSNRVSSNGNKKPYINNIALKRSKIFENIIQDSIKKVVSNHKPNKMHELEIIIKNINMKITITFFSNMDNIRYTALRKKNVLIWQDKMVIWLQKESIKVNNRIWNVFFYVKVISDSVGTPSKRGNGTVKLIPASVPTHRRPLQAISAVTLTGVAVPFNLVTFDAILISWNN
ncbi:hypothetical protein AGLY_012940 [Aphis glycines]|uniref:Uncharacterized protein n=1 Tax=Aphis glycines TaxID=307491 RepID=A0A6G0T9D8_APHGL|nr:hypothetical protein AGLY_012940 [Aphis glycines]